MSDSFYFWSFGVFEPNGQMGFNFGFFPKFGVFTSFYVMPFFLGFLGIVWFVDLDDLFGYPLDHFSTLCCIGMHVASVILIIFLVE